MYAIVDKQRHVEELSCLTIKNSVHTVVFIMTCMVIVENMEIHIASAAGTIMFRNAADVRLNVRNNDSLQLSITRRIGRNLTSLLLFSER